MSSHLFQQASGTAAVGPTAETEETGVPPEVLRRLLGRRVRIHGLTGRTDLNGKGGTAKRYHEDRGRVAVVDLNGSDGVLVRVAQLRLVSDDDTGAAAAPGTVGGTTESTMRGTASSAATGELRYQAIANDLTGRRRKFAFPLEVLPSDVARLHSAKSGDRDDTIWILQHVIRYCQPAMIAAEPWVCTAMDGCTRWVTGMLNTPAFIPTPFDGGPPIVSDYCPIPVCADPACQVEAQRVTQKIIKKFSKQFKREDINPNFSENQVLMCAFCKKLGGSELQRCGRCLAVWYCDAACQKAHWIMHKEKCLTLPAKCRPIRTG